MEKCYYYDEGIQRLEELLKHVAEEDREAFKQEYIYDLEEICPSDKAVILLYYETEDGGQLNFLLKDYLEDVPMHNLEDGIMYDHKVSLSCRGKGIHDYPLRVEILKRVEKDFDETLEIELFSRYIEIPEEITRIV